MKAPDIPGKIMAQMAIAPERRINHQSSGVLVGVSTVIVYAMMAPTINEVMVSISHFFISLDTMRAEITMRPKKKDQMYNGWVSSKYFINFASENMDMAIPATTEIKKFPLMCFQNSFNWKVPSKRNAFKFIDRIDSINSS